MMLHKGRVSSRLHFGTMIDQFGLQGVGVEVGTDLGYFALSILNGWNHGILYCVDPYELAVGYAEEGSTGTEASRKAAHNRLAFHIKSKRCNMIQCTSSQAVHRFSDNSLAFVYVDGDHTIEHVRHDLAAWWPKITKGGLLAGHDFICPGEVDGGWGRYVQQAVIEHATKHNVDIYIIVDETDTPWSFYMFKT